MKYRTNITSTIAETEVVIYAKNLSSEVEQLQEYLDNFENKYRLKVRKEGETYWVPLSSIYRVFIENRKVIIRLETDSFTCNQSLSKIKEILPSHFLQISQSEIVNSHYLDHLHLNPNGLITIALLNGDETYSSRRYLKVIKKELKL